MRALIDQLQAKGKLYKQLVEIQPKVLQVRNKIRIFSATDTNGYYTAIFMVSQMSRLLMKDVLKFEEIYQKLVTYSGHNYKYKILIIDAPLCSKAQKAFRDASWKMI
ncbi:MAG: hypothetical protein MUP09_07715 [Thiovulaceae bacterium]|nr:hypothetical protein [Sulfurimonadaceae bacterium]